MLRALRRGACRRSLSGTKESAGAVAKAEEKGTVSTREGTEDVVKHSLLTPQVHEELYQELKAFHSDEKVRYFKETRAKVYQPSRNATQQMQKWSGTWVIEFERPSLWRNALMGWTSGDDFGAMMHLQFNNKEDALAYAEKQGLRYTVVDPPPRRVKGKSYASNFKWKGNPSE